MQLLFLLLLLQAPPLLLFLPSYLYQQLGLISFQVHLPLRMWTAFVYIPILKICLRSVTAPSTSGSTTSRHSTGMIVGSVLGGLIVLLIALGIIGFVILRRRRKATTKIEKSMISVSPILPMQRGPQTPVLPFQPVSQDLEAGGTAFPFPVPRKAYSPRRSIASSFYSTDAHSRGGSVISTTSLLTTPMTGVPQLNVPQPRSMSSRKSAPRSSGLVSTPNL